MRIELFSKKNLQEAEEPFYLTSVQEDGKKLLLHMNEDEAKEKLKDLRKVQNLVKR